MANKEATQNPMQQAVGLPADNPIPDQLKKQIAEAEALQASLAKPGDPGDGQQPKPQEPAQPAPPQPAQPSPPPPAAAQDPHSQPPPVEDQDQRFKSLQGRLDKERETNQALIDRISSLEGLLANMRAVGVQPADPDDEPQPRPRPVFLSDEERTEYGDELLDVVGKRAREELVPEVEELKATISNLQNRLDGLSTIQATNAQKGLYGALAEQVPNWREQNTDPDFLAWLNHPDPFSGQVRGQLLRDAFARQDTSRVINFFRGYQSEATGTPPNGQAPGHSAPPLAAHSNGNGSGKPALEDFAAPGRARSAPAAELPADKPVYTYATISRFWADKTAGKWRGREAEAAAIEADIFRAQHEGRIQVQ